MLLALIPYRICASRCFALSTLFKFIAIVFVATGLLSCSQSYDGITGNPPRRVIWIAVDSLRADHLGFSGYPRDTSPWLDNLAADSARFDWAVSPANGTLKSVAAYFSGVPFSELGDPFKNGIPEETTTLAEVLANAGVRCYGITANTYIPPARGYAQGFSDYRIIVTPAKASSSIDEIIDDVRAHYRPNGGREFIYIHTMDVHSPYRPPFPYGTQFTQPYARSVVQEGNPYTEDRFHVANSIYPFWSETHDVTQEDIEFLRGLYDGAIRYTDERLPDLLEALRWDPEHDLVVISADHGESMYEHGWWGHFGTLAPTEIHVPLIMNYSGVSSARHDTPVSLIDLYPTILDAWGIPHPDGLMGTSLIGALDGRDVRTHDVYSESALANGASAVLVAEGFWYFLRGNRTEYQPWHPWPYEEFLYHYSVDPQGATNLIDAEPVVANALNARLAAFNERWAKYTPEKIRKSDEAVTFGDNLLHAIPVSAPDESVVVSEGSWTFDVNATRIAFAAEGLTPKEPVFLEVPYSLSSGRFRVTVTPAAYRWPGSARESEVWEHVCAKPGDDQKIAVAVLPLADKVVVEITAAPGTRGRVDLPSLRTMQVDRVEPWLRRPDGDSAGPAFEPEEVQRMKALGYL